MWIIRLLKGFHCHANSKKGFQQFFNEGNVSETPTKEIRQNFSYEKYTLDMRSV